MKIFKIIPLLLLTNLCFAVSGPIYNHENDVEQKEWEHVYQELNSLLKGNVLLSSTTVSSATITSLYGVADGSSACAGCIGEYVSSTVSFGNFTTSSQFGDLTSIALTAGDWDISVNAWADPQSATTWATWDIGISTTTGNSSAGLIAGLNWLEFAGSLATDISGTIANYRASITSSQTYNIKYMASYTGSAPRLKGRISARRER